AAGCLRIRAEVPSARSALVAEVPSAARPAGVAEIAAARSPAGGLFPVVAAGRAAAHETTAAGIRITGAWLRSMGRRGEDPARRAGRAQEAVVKPATGGGPEETAQDTGHKATPPAARRSSRRVGTRGIAPGRIGPARSRKRRWA